MKRKRNTAIMVLLLVALFSGSVAARRQAEAQRGSEVTLEEVLYLPSGKVLKKLSLGYSSLLADIYWTRAVQYFGVRVRRSSRFDLLYPLLQITTDLDPNLVVAYQSGSIFLSERPPYGAGQPDKAVDFLEKGIHENPRFWRLYFSLGFVHYLDRRDYKAAEAAFRKGSEVPGALPWMKVMAARMAEQADDLTTSLALWEGLYQTSGDKDLKTGALLHINSLKAERAIVQLEALVRTYKLQTGVAPASWSNLIQQRLLPGVPLDPTGDPFKLMPDGTVQVERPDQFPFMEKVVQ